MGIGLAYWILMLVWLVFGLYLDYTGGPRPMGRGLLLFVLLLLLGWHSFGPPIR